MVRITDNDMFIIESFNDVHIIFLRWLKSNNLYNDYRQEFIKRWKNNKDLLTLIRNDSIGITNELLKIEIGSLISRSFVWIYTKRGHQYWHEIDIMWSKYVKTKFICEIKEEL
mgnify:CR=1 FL=1